MYLDISYILLGIFRSTLEIEVSNTDTGNVGLVIIYYTLYIHLVTNFRKY